MSQPRNPLKYRKPSYHRLEIGDLRGEDLKRKERELFHPVRLENGCWLVQGAELPACSEITALLYAGAHAESPEEMEYLFWAFADLVWNQDPDDPHFSRHKWAHRMIHHACREKYLAVGGAASSGKSWTMGGWALWCFLIAPHETIVLVTSTDLKGARKRIWGAITKLLADIPEPPVRVQDSIGSIRYDDGSKTAHMEGIHIVTADKSSSKDKVGKLIGTKAKRVILIADELGDIGPNIQTAATGNLAKNPHFQMIGMSNPASRFDPFGVFSFPENGWDSVNVETDSEWITKVGGLFIRLDAEDSPNLDADDPDVPWETGRFYNYLPTQETIDADLDATMADSREAARKTRTYMRFNRAVFFDSDDDTNYYTEADIRKAGADNRTELMRVIRIAGIDPSFSSNGDKTVVAVCEIGYDNYGQQSIMLEELVYLHEDMTNKADPRTLQVAEAIKRECLRRKIPVENVGIDATGAGGGLCDMLQLQWAEGFLRVQFGGAPSDKKVRNDSKTTAKERYWNRASELFFTAKQYLLGRQVYGLPGVVIKQMCTRLYEVVKSSRGILLKVEGKEKYKARVGSSPDETDAYLVAVELARTRFGFLTADPVKERMKPDSIAKWLKDRGRDENRFDPSMLGHDANLGGW